MNETEKHKWLTKAILHQWRSEFGAAVVTTEMNLTGLMLVRTEGDPTPRVSARLQGWGGS